MVSETSKSKSVTALIGIGLGVGAIIGTLIVGIIVWHTPAPADTQIPEDNYGEFQQAAVTCDAPHCAQIGKSMLQRGGSVADAAIATLLCMGVIHSESMGIGGGFLMVMYNATERKSYALNAREKAPAAAFEEMFDGNSSLSQTGGLAVAIPGEIRGYWELHQKSGKLPWSDLFQPTIKLCDEGFSASPYLAYALNSTKEFIENSQSMREIFVNPETGTVYKVNDTVYRKQLARTLERIAKNGVNEFYEGETAKMFIDDLQKLDGTMTMEDLKDYQVNWTNPIEINLLNANLTLHAVPPPGSGVLMAFMMKVLDEYSLNPASAHSVVTYQRITEAFKHAYAKRTLLGDAFGDVADFVNELVSNLTSDGLVEEIRSLIQDDATNNTYEYYGAEYYQPENHGTAHISVIGPNGDAIAITSTINLYFGAKIRSTQTGIIYNDEMDDFSAPNITNAYGVPPSPKNFIRPGKAPLSSMTPAIFTDQDGNVRLTLGAAGGTKITSATTWVAIRNLWFGENIKDAIDVPRLHHQLYPMTLQFEPGFPEAFINGLEIIGHETETSAFPYSVTCGIARYSNGTIIANSDYRKGGTVAGY